MNKLKVIMKTLPIIAATLISVSALANASDKQSDVVKSQGAVSLDTIESLLQDTSYFAEKDVVVEGRLIRQISADTFILSDGKSEIQVELDDDIKLEAPLDEKQKLRLFGEYEGGNTPEIEVEHIQIL